MNADALLGNRSRRRRARRVSWLFMIVAVLSLAAASCGGHPAPATGSPPVNSLTVKACTVDGLAARCGTLIVPEDRLTGTGRAIPVRFVVFPATGPDRAPDPVVYFAGGPGVSAIADRQHAAQIAGLLHLGENGWEVMSAPPWAPQDGGVQERPRRSAMS